MHMHRDWLHVLCVCVLTQSHFAAEYLNIKSFIYSRLVLEYDALKLITYYSVFVSGFVLNVLFAHCVWFDMFK